MEQPMKLSTARVKQTLGQLEQQDGIENTVPVPEDSPVLPQLSSLFGDHTFFLDSEGLHIVEPIKSATAGGADGPIGQGRRLGRRRTQRLGAATARTNRHCHCARTRRRRLRRASRANSVPWRATTRHPPFIPP